MLMSEARANKLIPANVVRNKHVLDDEGEIIFSPHKKRNHPKSRNQEPDQAKSNIKKTVPFIKEQLYHLQV